MPDEHDDQSSDADILSVADIVWVDIDEIKVAESPRLTGEDVTHTQMLAELDEGLPPIIVHRSTMHVIDGLHRLRAAAKRGDRRISVVFFDGDDDAAFVLAVEANISHGLPLSTTDRQAAAARILDIHPEWSDRRVAASTGLSADTVGGLRRATVGSGQLTTRIGRDGRVRPLDSTTGRQRAADVIRARPDASLREIARTSGVAVGTARDVRERLRRGEDPVSRRPNRRPGHAQIDAATEPHRGSLAPTTRDVEARLAILRSLRQDPTLRFSEAGRHFLRWLLGHAVGVDDYTWVIDAVPAHCVDRIADLARGCAEAWQDLADRLEQRAHQSVLRTADADGD